MLTAVLMLCANIHLYKKRKGLRADLLDSYIEAGCVWTLYLFVLTEILSLGHLMRFRIGFMAWASLDMILAALLLVQCGRYGRINKACFSWSACVKAVRGCKDGIGAACFYRQGRETVKREGKYLYYGITVLIGAAVLWLAYKTTPYNWDSMTYHLPRISYWIQNRSVEHYATNSIRQIASPVLAEFINLHVCILSRGGDELFNMLQAFSYITCAVLVNRITQKLGGSREFGFMAALIYMTMPIAYAEALTTQVDLFATVWLLFYVYILLDLVGQNENLKFERTAVSRVCVLAACVAWGYLSKPSVCFAMVIFALWLLIRCIIRKDRVWELFRLLLCAIPCVSLPLVPEILRNFRTFQSYANTIAGEKQMVATLQPAYLLVNFLKNFTFNMPTALIKNSERYLVKLAEKAAAVLCVELNAESIAENGMEFRLHTGNTYGHNTAINPIVMWLFLFCAVWTVLEIKKINKGGDCLKTQELLC